MIVVPWPRKMRHCMCVWLCWHFFFSARHVLVFFMAGLPPSRFRYHRPRIATNGNQLGPVSWSIEHMVFVTYRIGILPRSACAINSQTPRPMPNPQHVSVLRLPILIPTATPQKHKAVTHFVVSTHSVSVLSGCCCLLVPGWHRLRPLQRRHEHGGEQPKNEGCARFATKFRPSTVK